MNINRILELEIKAESEFLSNCKGFLKHSPHGRLESKMCRGNMYYSQAIKNKPVRYLGKANQNTIDALKSKRYCQEAIKTFENNIPIMTRTLSKLQSYHPDDIIKQMPASIVEFPEDCYEIVDTINAKRWAQTPYPQYAAHAENLRHRTAKGDIVRSKSEMDICNTLFHYGIPYSYERPLWLPDGKKFHPDIVAYSWYLQRLFYWEHSGITSDDDYLISNENKFEIFKEHGIVQWNNLILTFDDPFGNLDSRIIDNIVRLWFVGN